MPELHSIVLNASSICNTWIAYSRDPNRIPSDFVPTPVASPVSKPSNGDKKDNGGAESPRKKAKTGKDKGKKGEKDDNTNRNQSNKTGFWSKDPTYVGIVQSKSDNGLIKTSVPHPRVMVGTKVLCSAHLMKGRGCTETCTRAHIDSPADLSAAQRTAFNQWLSDYNLELTQGSTTVTTATGQS